MVVFHKITLLIGLHGVDNQGRRHGFLSEGRVVSIVQSTNPQYPENGKGHRIRATSFSNLGGRPLLTFHCRGRVSRPTLSTPIRLTIYDDELTTE